jgi:tRNA-specific 2-thiouridylase
VRVLAALSGGVDSAVAAARCLLGGDEVVAVHFATGASADEASSPKAGRSCCGADDARDARAVAARLGVPFYVVDASAAFREAVLHPFVAEHVAGRTPNPCVACNRAVKFGRLLSLARDLGAGAVATGHYARTVRDASGRVRLLRGRDASKDQSYVLSGVSDEALALARFPLGDSTKEEVRDEARAMGLPVAEKPDSQELCFVPGGDHRVVLRERAPGLLRPGPVVDLEGRVLGAHDGAAGFTVGQRRGLRIASTAPLHVAAVDPATDRVVVGRREDLLRAEVVVGSVRFVGVEAPPPGTRVRVEARIRHGQAPSPATLVVGASAGAVVSFDEPVFAPAPGQVLVAYDGEAVLCGGTIEASSARAA